MKNKIKKFIEKISRFIEKIKFSKIKFLYLCIFILLLVVVCLFGKNNSIFLGSRIVIAPNPTTSPSPTATPTPTPSLLDKVKLTNPTPHYPSTSSPIPTATNTPVNNDNATRQQIIDAIAQYNQQISQQKSQQAQTCNTGTENANNTYNPQIQELETQLSDLRAQEKIICPYDFLAEACQVGTIYKQLQEITAKESNLIYQIGNLQTHRNNLISLACGGGISFPDFSSFIQPKVPTYYKIQPSGNGYVMYDLSGSTYLRIQSDGFGGYTVY